MKRNKKLVNIAILSVVFILLNSMIIMMPKYKSKSMITVKYSVVADKPDSYQLFYSTNDTFAEEQSAIDVYAQEGNRQSIQFEIPTSTKKIRLDFGSQVINAQIENLRISYLMNSIDISDRLLRDNTILNELEVLSKGNRIVELQTLGNNPYIILDISDIELRDLFKIDNTINYILKMIMCVAVNIILLILIKLYNPIKRLFSELYSSKKLIWDLAKNDFKTKYAGSYLGIFWAFVQPVITVLVYWFVFQVGFRSAPIKNFPFILWLVCGLVPWFFFAEAVTNATNAMIEYSYLVKKVVFKISILPIVKILSALFIHMFFVGFVTVLFIIYGYMPTVHIVQALYYTFCMIVLVLGISYITSSVIVFFKDLGQIVAIVLQIGIWMTPIMWNYNIIPPKIHWLFKLNPMYYIVEGYRDTFINHVWAWERYNQTIYFWVVTIVIFSIGTILFKKLKVHFADVL